MYVFAAASIAPEPYPNQAAAGGTGDIMRALRFNAILAFVLLIITARTLAAQESVLFSFDGTDGYEPIATLVSDTAGNLYGVTIGGALGTVFELSPAPGGGWNQEVLHAF